MQNISNKLCIQLRHVEHQYPCSYTSVRCLFRLHFFFGWCAIHRFAPDENRINILCKHWTCIQRRRTCEAKCLEETKLVKNVAQPLIWLNALVYILWIFPEEAIIRSSTKCAQNIAKAIFWQRLWKLLKQNSCCEKERAPFFALKRISSTKSSDYVRWLFKEIGFLSIAAMHMATILLVESCSPFIASTACVRLLAYITRQINST